MAVIVERSIEIDFQNSRDHHCANYGVANRPRAHRFGNISKTGWPVGEKFSDAVGVQVVEGGQPILLHKLNIALKQSAFLEMSTSHDGEAPTKQAA